MAALALSCWQWSERLLCLMIWLTSSQSFASPKVQGVVSSLGAESSDAQHVEVVTRVRERPQDALLI